MTMLLHNVGTAVEVYIKPLKTGDFNFSIIVGDKDADYSWGLVGAKGY